MGSSRYGLTRALATLVPLLYLAVSTHSSIQSAQLGAASGGAHSRGLHEQSRFTHISVIGERNSGTNFIRKLLENNLAPTLTVLENVTQHKHYMQVTFAHVQLPDACVGRSTDAVHYMTTGSLSPQPVLPRLSAA